MLKNISQNLAAVLLILSIAACASTGGSEPTRVNKLPSILRTGVLAENTGVIVMSVGRKQKGLEEADGANWAGVLPFVSYHIVRVLPEGQFEEIAFFPAVIGNISQINKGDFGFVHYREVPTGDYMAIGDETRGGDMVLAGGGYFLTVDPGSKTTDIAFSFTVRSGVVNYLGELVTMNNQLKNSSIRMADEYDRDIQRVMKRYSEVKEMTVNKVTLEPIVATDYLSTEQGQ